jgi:hypothetical protein
MAQHPLAYRVHFAAIGWADRQGHAGFEPGRLAALLGKEGKTLSDQSTRNAVARAKELEGEAAGAAGRPPQSQAAYDSAAPKGADRSKPARPRGRSRAPQAQPKGPVPCRLPPPLSAKRKPVTRSYALAVAVCEQGRRTLKPWRNLGCYDMAVDRDPFRGSYPHPLPLPRSRAAGRRCPVTAKFDGLPPKFDRASGRAMARGMQCVSLSGGRSVQIRFAFRGRGVRQCPAGSAGTGRLSTGLSRGLLVP